MTENTPEMTPPAGGAGAAGGLDSSTPEQPVAVALIGASNLSRGYWALSRCIRKNLQPRPVRVLTALGPGRGYVAPGGLWRLQYPPIKNSPVVSALGKYNRQGEKTVAFLTDLGNDFLYNVTGDELIGALERMVERLRDYNTEILVTPIHPVLTRILTPELYAFLRTTLYPNSKVPYEQVIEGIESVNRYLLETEQSGNIRRVEGLDAFLGWDYVHYGWMRATGAWSRAAQSIVSHIRGDAEHSIPLNQMLASYLENSFRLVGIDMLRWAPRRQGFF